MGREGDERGGIPLRVTPPPTINPGTAVFILCYNSEDNRTMCTCLDYTGNRVVTGVDK